MQTTNEFGGANGTTYTHELIEGSEAENQAWMDEVANFCQKAGIPVKMNRQAGSLEMKFESHADQLMVRDLISNMTQSTTFSHGHSFDAATSDEYREAWIFQARKTVQDAGLPHRFEEEGRDVVFEFQSFGALSMFTELLDTGYFDVRANTQLRTVGPTPPGAIPQ